MTLILLEDDRLLRKEIGRFLRRCGYEVHATDTVAGFLALASSLRFEACLLDLALPDGDGLAAWSAVRTAHPDAAVIVMTAHGGPGLAERAAAAGVSVVLPKPLDLVVLQTAVAAARPAGNLGVRAA